MAITIYDASGRPIEPAKIKDKLEKEYAAPQTSGVRNVSDKFAIASITPQKMGAIIKAACEGDVDDLLTIAEEIEERDAHYRSVLQTRKLAIRKLVPSIEPISEDKKDIEIAHILEKQIKKPSFRRMIGDLMDAVAKGYSVVEMMWDTQSMPWTVKSFTWRDPRLFKLYGANQEIRIKDDDNQDGLNLEPFNFIVHTPPLKSGFKSRGGLAMPLVWAYLFKNYTIKDWVAFVEVFGMPIRIGSYGAEASENDIDELIKAVVNIGSDAAAVIPQNMAIDIKEASGKAASAAIFESLAAYMDKQISKLVLGQTMTADDGSSQAQATVHDDVREDILVADGQDLADTINEYFIKPFVYLNFEASEDYPSFKLELIEQEDKNLKLDVITKLAPMGLKVSAAQIYEEYDLRPPEDESDILAIGSNPLLAAENRFNTFQRLAFNNADKAPAKPEQITDEIGDYFLEDWQPQAQGLIEPILHIAQNCKNYDEFLAELEAVQLDSTALQQGLLNAQLVGRALGDVQDELYAATPRTVSGSAASSFANKAKKKL